MNILTETELKLKREFLPEDFKVSNWEGIEPFYQDLQERELNSPDDLRLWLTNRSELESILEEDLGWRYIKMTEDTANKELKNAYSYFISSIQPYLISFKHALDEKFLSSDHIDLLTKVEELLLIKKAKSNIALFKDENIPLQTKDQLMQKEYGVINGDMTVQINGKELPLPLAATYLLDVNRSVRQDAFEKIHLRRKQDAVKLDDLFSDMVSIRHSIGKNAGFKNYRDYKFEELHRFDYTVEDCLQFHDSIASEIMPICDELISLRQDMLGLDTLKPWDIEVDISGKPPLIPFSDGDDLMEKTIECFTNLHPSFGEYLQIMKNMGRLDLEARKGKAPGGYNYPLYETSIPFIFMNSAGTVKDVITMVHEGGHAVHSFLTSRLSLVDYKILSSEIAELASMSMELLSMQHWEVFYSDEESLKRAKLQQLERVILIFPWVATIDKFQHWIYSHPDHTVEERSMAWVDIFQEYNFKAIDWSGQGEAFSLMWQKQLHIFEVPFYYIEYAMAQLGAIAIWKQFKESPKSTLDNYINALSLGYTKPIPEIYKAAGIKFDFSRSYVRELILFVRSELETLI